MHEIFPPHITPEQLQSVLDANPFSEWLQLQVVSVTEQGIELYLPGRPEMLGTLALKRLHGGVITSLVDAACGYAVLAACGQIISTVSLFTDFHRPAGHGDIHIKGRVLHQSQRISTAEAFIRDNAGNLLASGRCTIYKGKERHPALTITANTE